MMEDECKAFGYLSAKGAVGYMDMVVILRMMDGGKSL